MNAFQYGFFDELAKLASDVPGQRIDEAYLKTPLGQAQRKADSAKTVARIRAREEAFLAKERQKAIEEDRARYYSDGPFTHFTPLEWGGM